MWDERYSAKEFAFGELPNEYFKQQIQKFTPGKLLMPAEGEGRNAVYAAGLGWQTTAFDLSGEGKKKADLLASKNQVAINYLVGEFSELEFSRHSFDAIGLIFAHFPPEVKALYHKKFDELLKPEGIIILEAFSKNHLAYNSVNPQVGGPKDLGRLYAIEEIERDFHNYEILELTEQEVQLNEGIYHVGKGMVIRFVGRKK